MSTLVLFRHAKAGSRKGFDGDDELRPLTKNGRFQAVEVAKTLSELPCDHIYSSRYLRCTQSVEAFADVRQLPVEILDALAEGSSREDQRELFERVGQEDAVLCSHGDVLGGLLEILKKDGVEVDPERCEKGSMWIIATDPDGTKTATYLDPPRLNP
ncbi:MAG: phosphoglycerate mutase family protein [Acidimicrobiia bacterium]